MLPNLLNTPRTSEQWLIWSFSHKDSHLLIGQALQKTTGNITSVTLTNGGSGYTSIPAIQFGNGQGSGSTFNIEIRGGIITSLTLTSGGTGYTTDLIYIVGGGGSEKNQETHDEMNSALQLQGSDLESVDINDPRQFESWIFSHYQEHFDAQSKLGI